MTHALAAAARNIKSAVENNLNYLAFIIFIPLFFLIQNKSPKKAFLISFVYGFLFYLCILYWLYHVTVVGLIIVCLYLALYFGIFGIIINRFGILIAPIAWIILEYIQANISILGFGWASLGYSQYKNLPLIQIADFSGVYGVSFIIMMVNVCIYMSLRGARHCSCGGRRSNPCRDCFAHFLLRQGFGGQVIRSQ
jgi:apolipoprotein N-acyltransferase